VNALCLVVAGTLRALLPVTEFTVTWQHSVEKMQWEEHYRIEGAQLRLTEARVAGSGAGIDPLPDATLRDGAWTWHPRDATFAQLRLTSSAFTRDYELCWGDGCRALRSLVPPPGVPSSSSTSGAGDVEIVEIRACEARTAGNVN
jgi:hypothetical protein